MLLKTDKALYQYVLINVIDYFSKVSFNFFVYKILIVKVRPNSSLKIENISLTASWKFQTSLTVRLWEEGILNTVHTLFIHDFLKVLKKVIDDSLITKLALIYLYLWAIWIIDWSSSIYC